LFKSWWVDTCLIQAGEASPSGRIFRRKEKNAKSARILSGITRRKQKELQGAAGFDLL